MPCEPVDDGNDCTNDICDENGQPTSVDKGVGETCSGGVCDGDGACVECIEDDDCGDGESCTEADHTCNPITCTDGKQNGDETDVDCGGSCAPTRRCGDTLGCNVAGDCQSGVCSGTNGTCTAPRCGDGVEQGNEVCDDGNDTNGDGCDDGAGDACRPTGCGNGTVTAPEVCDDGNNMNNDGCDNNCTVSACGNGVRAGTEACDDGDTMGGDGCSGTCTTEPGYTCNMATPNVCIGTCGDGVVVTGEACDDAPPAENGDGCSMTCTLEPGFNCTGSPSTCTSVCGDGIRVTGEGCDDHDTDSGDGCNSTCFVEPGWVCSGMPSTCVPICGDGIVRPGEACDDGDLMPGDGCRANCTIEPGFGCTGSPSNCNPICGDGMRLAPEVCDDGNTNPLDGCSATCTRENGWTCNMASPTVCTTTCGDGIPVGAETCDDGDLMGSDGCNGTCGVELGWTCSGTPSNCLPICGDGRVVPTEPCDDGNTNGSDGCSATCTVELGYNCQGSPSVCALTCGNGVLDAGEACDDGDNVSLDGCSASCTSEVGWTCTGAPSNCTSTCGDGVIAVGAETCDDGNIINTDGCSATCATQPGYTCTGAPSSCVTTCGDGVTAGTETCDDGCGPNTPGVCDPMDNNDGCSATCVNECGNGVFNPAVEQCEDGNRIAGDGCSATCTFEVTCGPGETLVQINSTDIPKTIVDNTPAGVNSVAVVPAANVGAVRSVSFGLGRITHGFVGDLILTLTSPSGRRRVLFNQRGGNNANLINMRLFDAAPTHVSAGTVPFSGPFQPEQSLSTSAGFLGQNPAGTWTLNSADVISVGGGTLVAWTLSVCYAPTGPRCGDGATDPGEECDDGNAVDNDTCNNACGIVDGCGDGNIDGAEACDDDNLVSGDGCSSTCTVDISCAAGETAVVASNLTSFPIPDNLPAGGALSPIVISTAGAITKLVPHIAGITHATDNQVDVFLVGPNGVTRTLSDDNGGTLANYRQTYFSDTSFTLTTTAVAPFYGIFRPEQSMATTAGTDFAGLNGVGTWNLRVADDTSGTTGTLDGWTLAMCVNPSVPFCGNGVVNGTEECDDGNQDNTDACTTTCQITDGCGDGNIDGTEACDDNNIVSGDGCSSTCTVDITCAAGEVPVIVTNSTSNPIPDSPTPGVLVPVTVAQTGAVTKLVPYLHSITHGNTAHLDIVLIGPNSVVRNLTDDNGTGANYRQTFLDDAATTAVTAGASPFTGRFRPEATISTTAGTDFRNTRAAGDWNLRVTDDTAGTTGTVDSWTLAMCVNPTAAFCGDNIVNGTDECDDGNLVDNDACNNLCQIADGCGDGNIDAGEECDDNNIVSGDGCSSTCVFDISCAAGQTAVVLRNLTPSPVPDDNGNDSAMLSTISVPNVGLVRRVHTMINATAGNLGDLDIYLVSPFGAQRTLTEDRSGTAYTATVFTDSAPTGITGAAPYTGGWRASQTLSDAAGFGNQAAAGTWQLRITDDLMGGTAGTLQNWALGLCVDPVAPAVCGNGITEPGETCDDGNAVAADGCSVCQIDLTCGAGQTPVRLANLNQPAVIADNVPAGTSNTLTVTNMGTVRQAVVVLAAASHTFTGDNDITLNSPGGTIVNLSLGNGGGGDNWIGTMFSDAGSTSIVDAGSGGIFRGRFRPEAPLSAVNGQGATGGWRLNIADLGAGDAGSFNSWSLGLCVE